MLKLMPTFNFNTHTKTKCGEIFCHNSTDFTVYCTFCEMKCFSFDDFLKHLNSLHFVKDLCKSEKTNQKVSCFGGFANDLNKLEIDEEQICENLIQFYDDNANEEFENDLSEEKDFDDIPDNDSFDEPLAILKKKHQSRNHQDIKCSKSEDDINNFESDEEYQLSNETNHNSCHKCGDIFKTAGQLKSHYNRIHDDKSSESSSKKEKQGKQISCNECDQKFPYKKSLYSHIVDYHLGFKCSMCDKRFKQLQQRDRHEFCHTAERVFFCNMEGCDKSFTHKYYLQRHIDSHNKERKFVCDFDSCNKAFHTLRCLKAHKNRHVKPKNLICDTCGYKCREYDRLRIHQRIHTGEKPYSCKECGKRFTSNAALLEHSVSHTGIRAHVCINCKASFTRQKSLYQHRLKCTGVGGETTVSSQLN